MKIAEYSFVEFDNTAVFVQNKEPNRRMAKQSLKKRFIRIHKQTTCFMT